MTEAPNIGVRMFREDLEEIPQFSLPAPFTLRWYQPGDDQAWLQIHLAADKYSDITPLLFAREFGDDSAMLAQRQAYLCDPDGRPIGTASAWFKDNFKLEPLGRLHWVAIVPEMQGKGLAKPLLSTVCSRFRSLGHERAMLDTSTGRIPAINLYLKFGFKPDISTDEDRLAWQQVAQRIDHPALAAFLRD
jgi:GNAT superfamily N-acetyltransferase